MVDPDGRGIKVATIVPTTNEAAIAGIPAIQRPIEVLCGVMDELEARDGGHTPVNTGEELLGVVVVRVLAITQNNTFGEGSVPQQNGPQDATFKF